ncbi:MAG: UDP-N-acetylmuramoyl-L-alanyl-D-glutamate--2,6-diaminopimelate ligase [Oscillospiraceae bacterium]|nr:UDP-N-acetylmuramoyl-L-alanyl-D-glutamate--2,6-diaminopimelate ligase [Oscillospiraceae bacterium]
MKLYGYDVVNVTDDTRNVGSGSLFVAIRGDSFDGESVAGEMLRRGAVAVMCERDLGLSHQIIVDNARVGFALAASEFYGNPASKLKLIAVTGTNGKTTVATLIKTILDKNGHKCGFIGTTCYDVCDSSGKVYESHLSTPRQDELYRLFVEMVENNAEYCVMEASSQALAQFRITGEVFEVGIFTNLTQDHLDWHKSMENYFEAKKSLFKMCKSAIICTDDEYGIRLCEEVKNEMNVPVVSYGVNNSADIQAVNIKTFESGISYWLSDTRTEKSFPVKFKMPGMFNAVNSAAAVIACEVAGITAQISIDSLRDCTGVRGRCEVVYSGDFTVIVDYAHTEDALSKILTCVRGFAKKRIICVFGAAGERDSDKRPSMGKTAAELADLLVITSDNPRFESPQKIIDEVVSGCGNCKNSTPFRTFTDRKKAIVFALSEAKKEDVVLLAGKGHETYQVIGSEYQPFDERIIVREILGI